jgi:putative hemolysin
LDHHPAFINTQHLLFSFLVVTPAASVVLIFLLILFFIISFLISGSQVAFFTLTYKDINLLKTKQQPSYKRVVNLLDQPKTLLASMMLVNSFVNIGIILISNNLIDSLHILLFNSFWLNFSMKVIIIAFFVILFGEVLPKIWATHHKIWFAATASLLVEIFDSILFRFSRRMVSFTEGFEKRFSPKKSAALESTQLDYAIDLLSENEASIEEKQILKGIQKFSDTTVKQVMRTRLDVCGIEYSAGFDDVMKKVEDLHYSRLPVYKNNLDEIAGILHTKDLLPYIQNNGGDFDWHTLVRQAYFVHEQKLIEDLLQEFRNKRMHIAVVVDEFGGTSGIVTLEDIMEEIIGDIQDEFDDEESVNKKIDDFTYIFEGKTMINDFCKIIKIPTDSFDELRGDSDSLAGLMLEIAGEFPQVNDEISSRDYIFIPLEINKNRIDKLKVIIKPKNK